MKTNSKKIRAVLIILLILTIAFIWGNSILDKEKSADESGFIVSILELVFGKGNVSEHFVRKLAHFTEYAVLGMELIALMRKYLLGITHGLFVAIVDESIQLFSGRGSSLLDVWLDFSGVIFGALIGFAVLHLIFREEKHLKKSIL